MSGHQPLHHKAFGPTDRRLGQIGGQTVVTAALRLPLVQCDAQRLRLAEMAERQRQSKTQ